MSRSNVFKFALLQTVISAAASHAVADSSDLLRGGQAANAASPSVAASLKSLVNPTALSPAINAATGNVSAVGGGEAFNGPVTSTTSIPIQVDHGITVRDAKASIRTCLFDGDPKRGLTSFFDRLSQIIFGHPFLKESKVWRGQWRILGGTVALIGGDQVYSTKNSMMHGGSSADVSDCDQSSDSLNIKIGDDTPSSPTDEESQYGSLCKNGEGATFYGYPIPVIAYQKLAKQPVYDELGNYSEDDLVLVGLSIETDPSVKGKISYSNAVTLPFSMDPTDYIECLKGELERKAK